MKSPIYKSLVIVGNRTEIGDYRNKLRLTETGLGMLSISVGEENILLSPEKLEAMMAFIKSADLTKLGE